MTEAKQRKPVAVIGAGGISGTEVIKALAKARVPVRAIVHKRQDATAARALGANETAVVELRKPTTIENAIAGAGAIYFIPPSLNPEEGKYALRAAKAAVKMGIERFVYVSVLHPHTPSMHHHMRKAGAEAEIRHLPLKWTFLQPAIYAQMVMRNFGSRPPGDVAFPYDPSHLFTVVDLRDVAEVAVKVLTETGHLYASYELAGDLNSMSEFMRIAARVRGVKLKATRTPPNKIVVPDRFKQYPGQEESTRLMYKEYDKHGLQGNTRILKLLLGRKPKTFEAVARSMVS